ncbi:MAG TPA: tetratricopeptide repeat protein [Caldimonas sp.]
MSGLADRHGNATSTGSRAALEASENALWRMLSFYGTPLEDLDAAIDADPAWLLPRLMKAGFLLNLTEPSLVAEAIALLDAAEPLAANANERERGHLAALRRVQRGDWQGAADDWGAQVKAEPRDVLALQWALLFDFYRGDAEALRERVAAVLPAWSEADPLYPYVLGHHAFGLEESGRYAEAEAVGRRAVAGTARVPWAIHAVAHVMEMQGRHAEGAVWMAAWRPFWGVGNGFAGHLGWHEALFALEARDPAKALEVFDLYLNAEANEITLQRVDAASLLWRLTLHGAEVGDRWQRLLAGWALADPAASGISAFNDVHALIALLGAGERAAATRWMDTSLGNAARGGTWNREVSRIVAAPLMQGLVAFADGRLADAVRLLQPLRGTAGARLGGSHAQRDVIDQTLLAAAARCGSVAAGRALLAERQRTRARTPLADWWAEALDARRAR